MLSYISHKFSQDVRPKKHEPRAALFLNRFSRTSTIMYATNGLAEVLGITADELNGKSFYYCIQENCLEDAVKCLESAKANDSIAYLRFWFRDPRQPDQVDRDENMDGNSSADDDDGGVHVDDRMDEDGSENALASDSSVSQVGSSIGQNSTDRSSVEQDTQYLALSHPSRDPNSRTSSDNSTHLHEGANDAIFDRPTTRQSSTSSLSFSTPDESNRPSTAHRAPQPRQVELEAVISCTSDGLVVVLRRARALVPQIPQSSRVPAERSYTNGCFASPWATEPILPSVDRRQYAYPNNLEPGHVPGIPEWPTVARADTAPMTGPAEADFMNSIREVAVFAWSLTGINGSLAQYGRGRPTGQSLPPGGLPIWKPDADHLAEAERHPYHGNNPQETRQHQQTRRTASEHHSSNSNNTSYGRIGGYENKPPSSFGHGDKQGYATIGSGKGDTHTFGQEYYGNPGNGNHDSAEQSYFSAYGDLKKPSVPIQYNDWYHQTHEPDYSYESRNSSNIYDNASQTLPNARSGTMSSDYPNNVFQYGSSSSYHPPSQGRSPYHRENAMNSTDAQIYLHETQSSNGYYGGNGKSEGDMYNWPSQPQQSQHYKPWQVPAQGQSQYDAT